MILASQVWTQVFWTSALAGGLLAGVPLMFTALGEAISERAGVLNIGLEGMMLVGAYAGFLGAYYGHSMWFGYLGGMGAGMLASCFMVVLCVWLGLDQIVVGIAITLAGEGITSVLYQSRFSATQPRLGGAYLAIAGTGGFQDFLTQGQGYMAIVIAMLARGRPIAVVVFSLMFGIALSLSGLLQIAGINLSPEVVHMLPFAAIIVALMVFARRAYLPPALALPYVRGAR